MIWVVEWSQPGQSDSNITLWNSQDEALAAACADIMDDIHHNWDLTDTDIADIAQSISDECKAMRFNDAIILYNDYMSDTDYECQQFYRVFDRSIQTQMPNIHLLGARKGATTIPAPPPTQPTAFKATKAGATCRGPCQTYNEYAYADRADGTHCCYQCKYMSQVFGAKAP